MCLNVQHCHDLPGAMANCCCWHTGPNALSLPWSLGTKMRVYPMSQTTTRTVDECCKFECHQYPIWRFPEMRVALNHSDFSRILVGFSTINQPLWGYPDGHGNLQFIWSPKSDRRTQRQKPQVGNGCSSHLQPGGSKIRRHLVASESEEVDFSRNCSGWGNEVIPEMMRF